MGSGVFPAKLRLQWRTLLTLLANFIRKCRYVDDLSTSAMFLEELKRLTVEADMVFASIGLK